MKSLNKSLMTVAIAAALSCGVVACRSPKENGEHPSGDQPAASAENPDAEHPEKTEGEHPEHPKGEHPDHPRGN